MKTINILTLALCLALALASCGKKQTKDKSAQVGQTEQAITPSVLEVDDVLARAATLTGQTVTVEGVCTHICEHGGRKIFLMGSDDTQVIRCEAGEGIGAFPQQCVNSIVRVKGTVVEQRINEAYLQAWEARSGLQAADTHHHAGGAACTAEQQARGEQPANTTAERIAQYRQRIAAQQATGGPAYLSFYHIAADSYEIVNP